MARRRKGTIKWNKDLVLTKKPRTFWSPFGNLVGDFGIGDRGQIRRHYGHREGEMADMGAVSSIGALAVVGAIVLAIGAYAYFTNKPQ